MVGKPHFYKTHGYWNCRCDGYHGSGWTVQAALEGVVRHMRWYVRVHGEQIGT